MYILNVPIKKKIKIAEDVYHVVLDLSQQEFNFKPGQYIRLTIPEMLYDDVRGNYRDFTITSSPNNKKELVITMRNTDSGFKRTLLESPIGTHVKITGPHGEFLLPEETKLPLNWIARGIGITPFISKLSYIHETKLPYKITLLYSNADERKTPFLKELKEFSENNPNFEANIIYESISENSLKKLHKKSPNSLWYITGTPQVVDETVTIVKSLGISKKKIFVDSFLGYEPGTTSESKAISRRVAVESLIGREHSMLDQIRNAVLLESMNKTAIVSETDAEGTIVYVNDKFVEVSKYYRDELIGQNHRILKSEFHPSSFYTDLWKTISSGKIWRGEVKNRAKDGTYYWVDTIINPILGKDNVPVKYISVRFLITERKKAEEDLQKAHEKLIAIDQAKSEFISFASHQLRTPISAISWYVERMIDLQDKPDRSKKYLSQLYNTTRSAISLVNDLLNISRIELGTYIFNFQSIDLKEINKEVLNELKEQIKEKKLSVKQNYDKNLKAFTSDPYSLRIILSNLLTNAVKYTPANGSVIIEASQTEGYINITICDTGYGIPKSAQAKIFEKMYRADNVKLKVEGTGLGLYMVKTVLDHLGGEIAWESKINKGTKFYIKIPIHQKGDKNAKRN